MMKMRRLLTLAAVLWIANGGLLDAQQQVFVEGQSRAPSLTLTTATVDSQQFATLGWKTAHVQFKFGTVTGAYTTCTAQLNTSYDGGKNFLTFGTAVTIVVTSTTLTAYTLMAQLGTTTVTTSAASATTALGFGNMSKLTVACATYGTSAPVQINVIGLS